MRKSIAVFLLAAIAAIPSLSALAGPITVPTGLHPGDHYRLAFVTSTSRTATSTNIADYNNFVSSAANSSPVLAALRTTWRVIGSTQGVAAEDNTHTNPSVDVDYPIYNLAGALVASTSAALWSATNQTPLLAPVNISDQGVSEHGFVWTGTTARGRVAASKYLGTPDEDPEIGFSTDVNAFWIDENTFDSYFTPFPFYAMSGVLTMVPEPSTMVLACLALGGLALSALRRRTTR